MSENIEKNQKDTEKNKDLDQTKSYKIDEA